MGKHIVALSGGKDSTAMLLRMIELKWHIDEIRFIDCGSWEFPENRKHIDLVEKYIGRKILRVKPLHSFDFLLSRVRTQKGKKGYGWPGWLFRWCQGAKDVVFKKGIDPACDTVYIGYSVDEIGRVEAAIAKKKNLAFPLVGFGMTGRDCLSYCQSKGFTWGGLYEHRSRVSCWCCPLQRIDELRNLRRYHPELWRRLLRMEKKTRGAFLGKRGDAFGLEKRFVFEESKKKSENPSRT
jgi:3'-phosphoadenosine 5'-phosphosulfate sulfotransferase (PAPS reductase)/FAD synthetase